MWVRLAKPYAGEKYGMHFPLIDGTEVAIAFVQGDPNRPYIAHAMHDFEKVDHVTKDNHTRNVIRTPSNNKLRMEDKRGIEHIKLSTEQGKSQLNLGHLVDNKREKRGEGFELRTDAWGAIRAANGLFISADAQSKAKGDILDMQEALSQIELANQQMKAISDAANQAKSLASDLEEQYAFAKTRLEQLKASALLASAPDGIALSSGDNIQVAANKNLMINSGGNTDIGVMKSFFIGIGEAFGVFVHKLGMKLIANQGSVIVQAQNDSMELSAKLGMRITSSHDEIMISGNKKVTLTAGGSYITISSSGIEHGTRHDIKFKCSDFSLHGPASMSMTTQSTDKGKLDSPIAKKNGPFSM